MMNYICLAITLLAVSVHCQAPPARRGPPRPPPFKGLPRDAPGPGPTVSVVPSEAPLDPMTVQTAPVVPPSNTPVLVPDAPALVSQPQPTSTQKVQQISPPRPKGCSPGCGPSEICAELGASYCRNDQICSVCIKMSSIRFPASAISGMFSQQQQQQQQPQPQLQLAVPQVSTNAIEIPQQQTFPTYDIFGLPETQPQQQQQQQPVVNQQHQQSYSPYYGPYQDQTFTNDWFGFPQSNNNQNSLLPFMLFDPFGFGFGF